MLDPSPIKPLRTTLAIAVSLRTTAMLDNSQPSHKLNASAEVRLQGDGAFPDGLYLGKLAARKRPAAASRRCPLLDRARSRQVHGRLSPWTQRFSRSRGAIKAMSRSSIEVKLYAGKKLLTLFAFTPSVCLSLGMCVVATRLARASAAPPNTAATEAAKCEGHGPI
jgi:hypothetical protein